MTLVTSDCGYVRHPSVSPEDGRQIPEHFAKLSKDQPVNLFPKHMPTESRVTGELYRLSSRYLSACRREEGVALRGSWCKDRHEEDSNFNCFVKWTAVDREALASHMKTAPLIARYLSPQIQNELIDLFANVLRSDIIAEAMKSGRLQYTGSKASRTVVKLVLCIPHHDQNAVFDIQVVNT